MNLQTIVLQVGRLMDNFSPEASRNVKDAKIRIVQQELSYADDNAFVDAVSDIMADENIRKFPTIAQLRVYIGQRTKYVVIEGCGKCDRGIISSWIYKDEMKKWYAYGFKCRCEASKRLKAFIPAPEIIYPTNKRPPKLSEINL